MQIPLPLDADPSPRMETPSSLFLPWPCELWCMLGSHPPGCWLCDLWSMLGSQPPFLPMNRMIDRCKTLPYPKLRLREVEMVKNIFTLHIRSLRKGNGFSHVCPFVYWVRESQCYRTCSILLILRPLEHTPTPTIWEHPRLAQTCTLENHLVLVPTPITWGPPKTCSNLVTWGQPDPNPAPTDLIKLVHLGNPPGPVGRRVVGLLVFDYLCCFHDFWLHSNLSVVTSHCK